LLLIAVPGIGICEGGCDNDPDTRFSTLEDIFGATGERWQASISIQNNQADAGEQQAKTGFGMAVDDVVVEWKEFNLVPDTTDCATSGQCAVFDTTIGTFFEGSGIISLSVQDPSTAGVNNDCDDDGDNVGGTDSEDCDGDGVRDVRVKAFSAAEPAGEFVTINCDAPDSSVPIRQCPAGQFSGQLSVSSGYDVPGVLFVAILGETNPVVTGEYFDYFDGTFDGMGNPNPCANDIEPTATGKVFTAAVLDLASRAGDMQVTATVLTDNGDNDGFADTSETVDMAIQVQNLTGRDLTDVTARLTTNSPWIDCILSSALTIPAIADGDTSAPSAQTFSFRVSDAADRATMGLSAFDPFQAEFTVVLSATEVPAAERPATVTLDLDIDIIDAGAGPTQFFEGFEGSDFGAFTTMHLNADPVSLNSNTAAQGYRCQYSDPDWTNSNSYGTDSGNTCYPNTALGDAFFFTLDGPGNRANFGAELGKSFSGTGSLQFGIQGTTLSADSSGNPLSHDTTPFAELEAVKMQTPICLSATTNSELAFKMQVSMVDYRSVGAPVGESAERAIVQLQLAEGAQAPASSDIGIGNWLKLEPFQNGYDQQGTDNYTNCLFDPVDDGNTEDTFCDTLHDPDCIGDDEEDPFRRIGPSSTCFPEFSWTWVGDTFSPFSKNNVGNGDPGSGLPGAHGPGTWVETKFNLQEYRGRRLRLRFLETGLNNGNSSTTYEGTFQHNPDPGDDGWWIDDVSVTHTLQSCAVIEVDEKDNSGLDPCGDTCTTPEVVVTFDPSANPPAPGQAVEIDASGSFADRCLDGVLQFRFTDAGGTLRDWTDNPSIVVSPEVTSSYAVAVRCSADPIACNSQQTVQVTVDCPSSFALGGYPTVFATSRALFEWSPALDSDASRSGDLATVDGLTAANPPGGIDFTAATNSSPGVISSQDISGDAVTPGSVNGFWYLWRQSGTKGGAGVACNEQGVTWTSGGSAEEPGRDTDLP
jgi:hypothetical protein